MSKYPNCYCQPAKYTYFRRRNKNGTLHLIRQCEHCGSCAQNPMSQRDYDPAWIASLPIRTPLSVLR